MIIITITLDWPLIIAVAAALLFFAIAYNMFIDRLGERIKGYTALAVAFGVVCTLAGTAIISWQSAIIVGLAFIITGTPMIAGDILRSIRVRENALQVLRQGRQDGCDEP